MRTCVPVWLLLLVAAVVAMLARRLRLPYTVGLVLAGMSLGFVTILVGIGQTIGPYVGGLMGDAFGTLGPTYLFSAGVFFAGALAALVLGEGGLDTGERVQVLPPLPQRRMVK